MNVAHWLVRTARTYPHVVAVCVGSKSILDYSALAERTARLAGYLRQGIGLTAGDRVAVFMTNVPEYLETLYAVWWAGLVAVPVNCKLHPLELEYILQDANAYALIVSDDLLEQGCNAARRLSGPAAMLCAGAGTEYQRALRWAPLPPTDRSGDDLAWLFYTSGTTGKPKGVMLSHRNLHAMVAAFNCDVDCPGPSDAVVYAAPFSHGAGMYNFPYVLKASRHVFTESRGFDPDELVRLSRSVGKVCLFGAPTMVRRLVDAIRARSEDCSGFRTIIYGGGPMYREDIRTALATMGDRFVQIYGQGESPMTITVLSRSELSNSTHPDWEARLGSVGVAQSVVEVRVVDASGVPVEVGETGEVIVRGDTVMSGYWENAEATRLALRNGWLWTGDVGSLDANGFLTLKDRSKDLIISGGANIYPREVEEVLLMHPRVHEAAVVGKPDPEWGEIVVAFVVASGVAPGELDKLCLERIARFKRPKEYRFVASLPKNNYGKVLKTELRRNL